MSWNGTKNGTKNEAHGKAQTERFKGNLTQLHYNTGRKIDAMKKKKILLTPELAKKCLANNYHKNRNIRPSVVNSYAIDIADGRWNEDISEIDNAMAFTKEGLLINGQHRCAAVIAADKAIYVWAYYDVPIELYDFFDGGAVRTAADVAGVPNARAVSALAKIVYAVKYGTVPLASALQGLATNSKNSAKVTRQRVLSTIKDENDLLQKYVNLAGNAGAYLGKKRNNLAIAFFLIDYVGRGDALDEFVEECAKLSPTSQPIIACRSYVSKCLANKNFKADRKWMVSCILATYEAFRDGREIMSFNKLSKVFTKYDKYVAETKTGHTDNRKAMAFI